MGASWGTGDQIIVGMLTGGLFQVPTDGGEPERLTTPDAERGDTSHRWPSIIPDHEAVLFTTSRGDMATSQLAILALQTGEVTRLGLAGTSPRYVPTRHLVYTTDDGSLRAVPFDPDQLVVTGNPITLVDGVMVTGSGAANVSISDTGRLAYMTGEEDDGSTPFPVWVDRNGEMTSLVEGVDIRGQQPRLSPDGSRMAVYSRTEGDIQLWDLERGSNTWWAEGGADLFPTWMQDSSTVTFASDRSGSFDLYSRPANVGGAAELLVQAPEVLIPGSWSPDGQLLVYYEVNAETQRDLWVLPVNDSPSPFLITEFNEFAPRLSPDGQWVAYISDQSGENRIYAQPFPEGGTIIPISTGPGTEPVWSRDGRELFYRNGNQMLAVTVQPRPKFSVGRPNLLFEGPYLLDSLNLGIPNYDVSLDGQHFLMVTGAIDEDATPPQITVVLNWFEELKRLVPTGP